MLMLRWLKALIKNDGQDASESAHAPVLNALDKSLAVIEFSPEGIVQHANANFLNVMGYNLQDIVGKHHSQFVPVSERDSQEYKHFWRRLSSGEFFSDEYKRVGANGKEIWIQATYNPIKNTLGQVEKVVKFATDITAGKLQDADYRGQIDAIHKTQAVIEFDLQGIILGANNNFLQAMGYSLTEVVGKHHSLFVDEEYKNSSEYALFWQKLSAGQFFSGEFKRYGKGQKEIWINASYNPIFDLNGKPVKVVKYATDVTQQKLQNADFEGQMQAISKSQAVISFDLDGNILEANDNFLNCMGYSANEVIGQHHSMFAPGDYASSVEYKQFWQRLGNGDFFSGEFQRVGKHGKEIWIQATYNPIMDLNGKPFKIVKFATDITEDVKRRIDFERLSLVANETDNSVVITDAQGLIEYVNPGFTKLTGYTFDQAVGKKPGALLQGPDTSEATKIAIRKNLDERKPFYDEILNYDSHGNSYWVSLAINPVFDKATGELQRFISIQANVTDTKVKSLEFTYKLDAISRVNAIVELSLQGTVDVVNDHYVALFGAKNASELIGKRLEDLLHGDFKNSSDYASFWKTLSSGQFVSGEYKHTALNGEPKWINGSFNPILNAQGDITKIVMFGEDVTDKKQGVNRLAETLRDLEEGKLSSRAQGDFGEELNTLRDSLNVSMEKLQTTMLSILDVAEVVQNGAAEISQGNNDLSHRVESQAASLEQTAATMEQLTSSARNNAENARAVDEESSETGEAAENGMNVVKDAVAAMQEITHSSKKISDIIGVIDEIAFQTNLLALNAAVEAARAGEQGRGFAVVAGEVRNLAQRSSQAAKEISTLIHSSSSTVERGTILVNKSGETLSTINDSVMQVSRMIADIASASRDQLNGIEQSSDAVTDMDAITQQNAALVEEVTAASASMRDSAEQLRRDLAFFQIR